MPLFSRQRRLLPFLLLTCASVAAPAWAQAGLGSNANVPKPETSANPPRPDLGSAARYTQVRRGYYGLGGQAYWLFEPAAPVPGATAPVSVPVIVFNHGWSATNPQIYGAWLDHLVRQGNIVIYPRYQADLSTPPTEWTPNAIAGIKAALERLKTEKGHLKPDLNRVAAVGHSVGGVLSANEAALAAKNGLPRLRAVMSVMPGVTWSLPQISIPLADLKAIPAATLLISLAGESDDFVRDVDAKRIFNQSTQITLANKDYVVLPTDAHGTPVLMADHLAPCAFDDRYDDGEEAGKPRDLRPIAISQAPLSRSVNALDTELWKLFDALATTAFEGKGRTLNLAQKPQLKSLGQWSDGKSAKEINVSKAPGIGAAPQASPRAQAQG